MKNLTLFLSVIIFVFTSNAQVNDINQCFSRASNIANWIDNGKNKENLNETTAYWLQIEKECPNLNEYFYKNGEIIFENQKEMSNTIEAKKAVVFDIINILDKYDAKFPNNKNGNSIKKALYLSDYKLGTNDEIFTTLDKTFKKDKANFKNPQALYLYFNAFVNQLKENKKGLNTDDLYTKHIEISQKINDEINDVNTKPEDIQSLKIVLGGTKTIIDPYITCDNLKRYCTNAFETNQNNASWLVYTSEYLFSKSCYNEPIAAQIASKSYEVNPTSKAAFYFGYIKLLKNEAQKSDELFNEAADKAIDKTEKAKIYYTIATVVYGINNKSKAATYLQKTIETDPNYAKAYLYLAQLYESSSECLTTEFDKKAIYWLIAETVQKAGKADKMFEKSTAIQAENYLKKAPTKAEIEGAGLKIGKKYAFKCWINQSAEIPKM
jgi:tetratricopeptide (TPR) repeat protein